VLVVKFGYFSLRWNIRKVIIFYVFFSTLHLVFLQAYFQLGIFATAEIESVDILQRVCWKNQGWRYFFSILVAVSGSRNIFRREILRQIILARWFFAGRFFARKKFPRRRKILRRSILCPNNFSLGYFFARKILRWMIFRRRVLRSDDSSPGEFFEKKNPRRRKILR
jgi:hypothetical protein